MIDEHVLTFDVDWAPDFAIEYVVNELIERGIKSTWFVTHASPVVEKLKKDKDLFELGIHPNFLPNSTQGKTIEEVMNKMLSILPGSKIVRTHAMFQSTYLYRLLTNRFGIEIDSSLLLPFMPNLLPIMVYFQHGGKSLTRIPIFWEDDIMMYYPDHDWKFTDKRYHSEGLKVYNFHPLHIWLNSCTMKNYEELKKSNSLNRITKDQAEKFKNKKENGVKNFFHELCKHVETKQKHSMKISEFV